MFELRCIIVSSMQHNRLRDMIRMNDSSCHWNTQPDQDSLERYLLPLKIQMSSQAVSPRTNVARVRIEETFRGKPQVVMMNQGRKARVSRITDRVCRSWGQDLTSSILLSPILPVADASHHQQFIAETLSGNQ